VTGGPSWSWQVGTDVAAIHALLRASDAHHAAVHGLPTPARRLSTTRRLVESGAVQTLRHGPALVGMFTLTSEPPFTQDASIFPRARRPAYLQRLAVAPDWLSSVPLVGVRCLRRAVQVATTQGADALRAEANPDLTATAALLVTFGFVPCGSVRAADGLRRVYLHKDLVPAQPGRPGAS
jgi:hypothetical protein